MSVIFDVQTKTYFLKREDGTAKKISGKRYFAAMDKACEELGGFNDNLDLEKCEERALEILRLKG